jgi:hypothetical protein
MTYRKRSAKSDAKRKLISEGDVLIRQLVLCRDGFKCCKCGGQNVLQAAHIVSKGRASRLRFELLNVITLCLRCHLYWAHRDPVGFVDWVEKTYPGRIEQLRIMAATAPKLDMKELLIALRLEVKNLPPPGRAVIHEPIGELPF